VPTRVIFHARARLKEDPARHGIWDKVQGSFWSSGPFAATVRAAPVYSFGGTWSSSSRARRPRPRQVGAQVRHHSVIELPGVWPTEKEGDGDYTTVRNSGGHLAEA
jgi:hypothetical protein